MSDRINTITVVLEEDKRDDDCERIVEAILMIRGVMSATPNVASPQDHMAEERARREFEKRLWDALHPQLGVKR